MLEKVRIDLKFLSNCVNLEIHSHSYDYLLHVQNHQTMEWIQTFVKRPLPDFLSLTL